MENQYEQAKNAAKETERLMKARVDFEKLKEEEESYLKEREAEAQALLKNVNKQTKDATKLLEAINDKAEQQQKKLNERLGAFGKGLLSLLDQAQTIIDSAEQFLDKAKKAEKEFEKRIKEVDQHTIKNSEFEKQLKTLESEVDKRNKGADKKLQEARDLAYWHKTGKRYTQPKK